MSKDEGSRNFSGQNYDSRDGRRVSNEETVFLVTNLVNRLSVYSSESSSEYKKINDVSGEPFVDWLRRPHSLALFLAVGDGLIELRIAEELGVPHDQVTLLDRNPVDSKTAADFESKGVAFIHQSLESWAAYVLGANIQAYLCRRC